MRSCPGCGTSLEDDHTFCVECGTSVEVAGGGTGESVTPEERVGTVHGNYKLLRILGTGGMGTVYEAEHVRLGRKVALKMLHAECCGETLHRFFGEARAVNQIAHDNIIDITDFVEDAAGGNFYVMEILNGRELQEVMTEDGVLPLGRSLRIASQIASALHAVHDSGVVHRDLKPANVFLTKRGTQEDFVKLLDFGVAKFTSQGILMQQTASGIVVGTPFYMSPEQIRGDVVDHRLDIYALGVILYQLIAGCSPFDASSFGDLVILQATQDPLPPTDFRHDVAELIPNDLSALILKCLAREPADRPESMAVIEAELNRIIGSLSPEAANDTGDASLLLRLGDEEDEFSSDGSTGMIRQRGGGGTAAVTAQTAVISARSDGESPPAPAAVAEPTTSRTGLAVVLGAIVLIAAGGGVVWYVTQTGPATSAEVEVESADVNAAPTAATVIEVRFRSEPEAEVFQYGKRLGATPFAMEFTSSSAARIFEFRRNGTTLTRSVSLDRDQEVTVAFEVTAPAPTPHRRDAEPEPPKPTPTKAELAAPREPAAASDPPTDLRNPWAD